MLKNKRTRVLLYILGSVLVVVIGLVIWGVASDKINTFADVVRPPIPSGFTIKGQITDSNSQPVPLATINLDRYNSATKKYSIVSTIQADGTGNYIFNSVTTGFVYRLTVYGGVMHCHDQVSSATLSGKSGETKTYNLTMKKYPTIKGKLTYKDGSVVENSDYIHISYFVTGRPTPIAYYPTLDDKGNYESLCVYPRFKTAISKPTSPSATEYTVVKSYDAIPWTGIILNVVLPFNRSDRPI